ncbi:hypothetical protein AGLY_003447 [Aphis glycines]|uniref:MULE transposase domain-containing protein n=1 Tax=Aphis glycines TaxID=307491 RepID=A0A6G0U0K7_APHGL|nr:hypothetical protein AGLY_003447 [Aphis glycines]
MNWRSKQYSYYRGVKDINILLSLKIGIFLNSSKEKKRYKKIWNGFKTVVLLPTACDNLYSEDRVVNGQLSLKKYYNRSTDLLMNYMDQLVRGLSTQNTLLVDELFRDEGDCITQNEREEAVTTYQSVKSSIHRNKRKEVLPQPENRKDLHIPSLWRQTLDGRNFILCDDDLDDKILIFGKPEIFSKMCDAKTLFMDAKANSLGKCLLLTIFQLDFELTMFNTIKNKYPDAQIRRCFFHYIQAVYKKVVDVGLRSDYVSSEGDPLIKTLVRRISALPLVPIEQLDDL